MNVNEIKRNIHTYFGWNLDKTERQTDKPTDQTNKHGFYRLKLGKEYNRKKEVELESRSKRELRQN